VSVEQYQRFVNANPQFATDRKSLTRYSPDPSGPMISVNWYAAARYCNWLSEREGLPEAEWCYVPSATENIELMSIPANIRERTGYRLPTEAEWEYACRSGTMTSRYFGISTDLLGTYAWYGRNSREHARPCGSLLPNDLGLFDMLGNVSEWCHEAHGPYGLGDKQNIDHISNSESINRDGFRIVRGGSFGVEPAAVRSADRTWDPASFHSITSGFRPARTYP